MSYAKGTECPHGMIAERCRSCAMYPPLPQPKDARILAISDELLKDLTEDRDPKVDEPLWTLQYQDRPQVEPIPVEPMALQHAADMLKQRAFDDAYRKLKNARLAEEMSQRAGETIDRLMRDSVNEENTFDDFTEEDDDPDDEGLTIRGNLDVALWNYAKQFHIPALEGEDIRDWYARVAPRLMTKPNGVTFLALLKAVVVAATGTTDDELDELIQRKNATPSVPRSVMDPLQSAPHPGHVPYNPPSHARTGCSWPCCNKPAGAIYHNAPAAQVDPLKRSALKDVDLGPLLGRQRHSAAPKDSILNPPVKGFVGSDKLGFDSDYD